MKKRCSLLMVIVAMMLVATTSVSAIDLRSRPLYTDIPGTFWAYDAIKLATDMEWFQGYSDGSFLPDKSITRAEAAKVLAVYLNQRRDPIAKSSFADISCDDWYATYVEAVKDFFPNTQLGGNFRPNAPMTREDTVYILVMSKGLNNKVKFVDMSLVENLVDGDMVNQEIKPYIAMGMQLSLVSGYSDGTLKPKNPLTRAEFATFLYRALNLANE